jgi:hypothetical protein
LFLYRKDFPSQLRFVKGAIKEGNGKKKETEKNKVARKLRKTRWQNKRRQKQNQKSKTKPDFLPLPITSPSFIQALIVLPILPQ